MGKMAKEEKVIFKKFQSKWNLNLNILKIY